MAWKPKISRSAKLEAACGFALAIVIVRFGSTLD